MATTGDDRGQRAREMYALYEQGATLEEIGICYGITRERVRQIFRKAGLASRSRADAMIKYSDEELLDCLRLAAHAGGGTLNSNEYDKFARNQRFSDGRRWPARLTLQNRFGSFVKARDMAGVRRSARKQYKLYSDAELIDCLRSASATLGGVLAHVAYDEFAVDQSFSDGRAWPTSQTHSLRFGSWVMALKAAGLPFNPSAGRSKLFEQTNCIDAVRSAARALGKIPTVTEYEALARESMGALPSFSTVRNRCGTWANAVQLAGL